MNTTAPTAVTSQLQRSTREHIAHQAAIHGRTMKKPGSVRQHTDAKVIEELRLLIRSEAVLE